MSVPIAATPPLPLRNAYWVVPGLLLAGEHPGGSTNDKTKDRLKKLLAVGIELFVDLTKATELPRYDVHLPPNVQYVRKAIRDHGIPGSTQEMVEILDHILTALREGRPVYLHCRAGIGRTGTVAGCLLVERGLSGDEALDELNNLWQQSKRSKSWHSVPETDQQAAFVRRWVPALAGLTAANSARKGSVAPAEDPEDPLLQPETLSAARTLRERFVGALAGLAVGDAVAAATQYRRPGTFTPVGDMLGGGPFELPRGAWSDDTAMALCLAESLLERNGFDARDQVQRYARWQQEGYMSSTGQCLGITANTARALAMARWRRQVFAGSHDPDQLDPEPLSRVGAIALFYFSSLDETLQQAADSARTTCQAPGVLEACRKLAKAIHKGLLGQTKEGILAEMPASTASVPATTTAPAVLSAALWAFGTTNNFRDAVLRAANTGGNSDVVAAVCGQLAGAHYGFSAIPATWRDGLVQRDLIEGFADRLLAHGLLSLGS